MFVVCLWSADPDRAIPSEANTVEIAVPTAISPGGRYWFRTSGLGRVKERDILA